MDGNISYTRNRTCEGHNKNSILGWGNGIDGSTRIEGKNRHNYRNTTQEFQSQAKSRH